ncbi:Smt3-specific protease [Tulasnella sp. 424]|nr:Smt3-specific protease [Tulasnella sp. 424]
MTKRTANEAVLPLASPRPQKRISPDKDASSQGVAGQLANTLYSFIWKAASEALSGLPAASAEEETTFSTGSSTPRPVQQGNESPASEDASNAGSSPSKISRPPIPSAPPLPPAIITTSPPTTHQPSGITISSPATSFHTALAPPSPASSSLLQTPFKVPFSPSPTRSEAKTPLALRRDPYAPSPSPRALYGSVNGVRVLQSPQVTTPQSRGFDQLSSSLPPSTLRSNRSSATPLSQRRPLFSSASSRIGASQFGSPLRRSGTVAKPYSNSHSLSSNRGLGVKQYARSGHIHEQQHWQRVRARLTQNSIVDYDKFLQAKTDGFGGDYQDWVSRESYRQLLESSDLLSQSTARKAAEFGARSTPLDAYPSTPSSLSRAPSSLGTHSDSTSLTSSQRSRRPSFGSMTSEGWSPPRSESSVSTARPVRMGDASSSLFGPRPAGADRPLPKRSVELEKALARARAALNYPRAPPPDAASFRRLELESRKKDEEIAKRIRAAKRKKLPEQLPARHAALVKSYMHDRGFSAKVGREMVTAKDIGRLGPASWLNDEIINLWGAMIMERAEKHKKAAKAGAADINGGVNGKGKERAAPDDEDSDPGRFGYPEPLSDVHYFNTFFFQKLENEGYEKARLGKWTKSIDIFSKDIILIPVNLGNAHWTCAAINMKKKRIEYYDSMGSQRPKVYQILRDYLEKEHKAKKSKSFNFDGWQNYWSEETPQQENGYDCGVFTCMFMEGLSRGEEAEDFVFEQSNMPYLRLRMLYEIGRGKLS